jgi:hypothetical protein
MTLTIIVFVAMLVFALASSRTAYLLGVHSGKQVQQRTALELPSTVCGCGGSWGSWSKISTQVKPLDPRYPSTGGRIEVNTQTRYCPDCGQAEIRKL